MNVRSRQKHFIVWILIGLILPVGFIAAYTQLPKYPVSSVEQPTSDRSLSGMITSASSANMDCTIYASENKAEYQLEIELLKPLVSAYTLVEVKNENTQSGERGVTLGKIGSKGAYYFSLPSEMMKSKELTVVIRDHLRNKKIDEVKLAGWE